MSITEFLLKNSKKCGFKAKPMQYIFVSFGKGPSFDTEILTHYSPSGCSIDSTFTEVSYLINLAESSNQFPRSY